MLCGGGERFEEMTMYDFYVFVLVSCLIPQMIVCRFQIPIRCKKKGIDLQTSLVYYSCSNYPPAGVGIELLKLSERPQHLPEVL